MKIPLIAGVIALIFVAGVGVYATDFAAYLGNNPSTCNNCHVMDNAYEGWYHAGQKQWITCIDCHTTHDLARQAQLKAVQAAGTPEVIQSGQYGGTEGRILNYVG